MGKMFIFSDEIDDGQSANIQMDIFEILKDLFDVKYFNVNDPYPMTLPDLGAKYFQSATCCDGKGVLNSLTAGYYSNAQRLERHIVNHDDQLKMSSYFIGKIEITDPLYNAPPFDGDIDYNISLTGRHIVMVTYLERSMLRSYLAQFVATGVPHLPKGQRMLYSYGNMWWQNVSNVKAEAIYKAKQKDPNCICYYDDTIEYDDKMYTGWKCLHSIYIDAGHVYDGSWEERWGVIDNMRLDIMQIGAKRFRVQMADQRRVSVRALVKAIDWFRQDRDLLNTPPEDYPRMVCENETNVAWAGSYYTIRYRFIRGIENISQDVYDKLVAQAVADRMADGI